MNKLKIITLSLFALSAFNTSNASNLPIKKSYFDNLVISNQTNNILNNVSKELNPVVKNNINNLNNTYTKNNIVSNENSFTIMPSKPKNSEIIVNKSNENNIDNLTENESKIILPKFISNNKRNEINIINAMNKWVNNYLEINDTKLLIAYDQKQLNEYMMECKKRHSHKTIVLDIMSLNGALDQITKNNPKYKEILQNKINYHALINLFIIANQDKKMINNIINDFDKLIFKYDKVNFKISPSIIDIYNEVNNILNNKSNKNMKSSISHPNSFSITEDNNSLWNKLNINDNKYSSIFHSKLLSLNNNEKQEVLEDLSEALLTNNNIQLPKNFTIQNQSVNDYFQSISNELNYDKCLSDIFYALKQFNISHCMNIFNPLSQTVLLINNLLNQVISEAKTNTTVIINNENSATSNVTIISKTVSPIQNFFSFNTGVFSSFVTNTVNRINNFFNSIF